MKLKWMLVGVIADVVVLACGCGRDPLGTPTSGPGRICLAAANPIGQVGNAPPPVDVPPRPRSCDFRPDSADRFESMSALVRLVLGKDDPALAQNFISQGLDASEAEDRTKVISELLTQEAVIELSDAWMSAWLELPVGSPFPARFDQTLWRDLRKQTLRHGRAVFVEASLDLDSFMTSSESFANDVVASHYNIAAPAGTSFAPVKLPTERVSVLGHAAVLGSHSTVSRRGAFLQRRFIQCQGVPDPPVSATHANLPTTLQTRTTVEAKLGTHPSCPACHNVVDVGFALSAFDERGQRRQRDADGASVDTRAVVTTFSGDFPVDGLSELATFIAAEDTWKTCLAQSLVEVAGARMGRKNSDDVADVCSPAAAIAREFEHDVSLAKTLPIVATTFFGGTIDLRGPRDLPPSHPSPEEPTCAQ